MPSQPFAPPPVPAAVAASLPPPAAAVAAVACSVAVIGAGAAGLVAARELRREGHRVVVFERGAGVGGTWVYTPATDSDPLGLDTRRDIVHTSLYRSLRTNLSRECMSFLDYPFSARRNFGDPRRFPGHREVLCYLEAFARDFDLNGLVRFRTEVVRVQRRAEDGRWSVISRAVGEAGRGMKGGDSSEVYDGVVVCNGHFTEPRLAEIPGIDTWPGKQIHSHNYRVPDPFLNKAVVMIGYSASANDISREISGLAKEVYISRRSQADEPASKLPGYDNVWLLPMIANACNDGSVTFEDGSTFHADIIMHCTGYKYDFPFLETNGIVSVDDNCVGPLYKHIFPPLLAPNLSFIGIPWKVSPFPLFELQSKWVAGVLSGRIALPTEKEMLEDVKALYSKLEAAGWPKRYAHNLSNVQFEYVDWLAKECGLPPVEEWRKLMYPATSINRLAKPESYRDEWEDDHLASQAEECFQKFFK